MGDDDKNKNALLVALEMMQDIVKCTGINKGMLSSSLRKKTMPTNYKSRRISRRKDEAFRGWL
jgi:hypothetical protein